MKDNMVDNEEKQKKMWMSYITKIIDRNIQRKRESGFTTWAMLGAISYLVIIILDNLSGIFNNFFVISILVLNITSLSFTLVAIYAALLALCPNIESGRRFLSSASRRNEIVAIINAFTMLTSLGVLSIYIGKVVFFTGFSGWSYYIMGAFLLIQGVCPALIYMYLNWKKSKNNILDYPEIGITNNSMFMIYSKCIFIGIINILFMETSLSGIDIQYILNNINIVKMALLIVAMMFLLTSITNRPFYNINEQWLENLELKIVVDGLDAGVICNEFIKHYLGQNILEWILSVEAEMIKRYEKVSESRSLIIKLTQKVDNYQCSLVNIKELTIESKANLISGASLDNISGVGDKIILLFDDMEDVMEEMIGTIDCWKESFKILDNHISFIEDAKGIIIKIKFQGITEEEKVALKVIEEKWQEQIKDIKELLNENYTVKDKIEKMNDERGLLKIEIKEFVKECRVVIDKEGLEKLPR